MKTPYDLKLAPVPGGTARIKQEDGTWVSFIVKDGAWVPHEPTGSGSVSGSTDPTYVNPPTGAVWIDNLTGKETPVNPSHMSTREEAEAMLAKLQSLAPGEAFTIQEIRPENPFSRIDYRGDIRRHWYINGYNVGLLVERYRRYSEEAADQQTLAELGRGKITTTVPITTASPPPAKTDTPKEPIPLVQPQPTQQPTQEPGGVTTMSVRQKILELARESGSEVWNWDQWNWFYQQATGGTPVSPESRGLTRNESGQILIDGQPTYSIDTWERLAGLDLSGEIPLIVGVTSGPVSPPLGSPPAFFPPQMNMSLLVWVGIGLLVLFKLMRS
jgi:hypothetical protein